MNEPRTLYRVLVRVNRHPNGYKFWTQNPEDTEDLKHQFQRDYGFWPDEIAVDDIIDKVVSPVRAFVDQRQPNFD